MKLVEIGDVGQGYADQPLPSLPTDENLTAPRILSMLDKSMNAILNQNDISDGEKWILYNQTLQKYLYHMKNAHAQKSNTQQLSHNIPIDVLESRHHTPDTFNNRLTGQDISGIFPIKPSISDITQPNVREFFEQARLSDPNMYQPAPNQLSPISRLSRNESLSSLDMSPTTLSPTQPLPQSMSIDIHTPERSNVTQRRRPQKRGASADITAVHPSKVISKEVIVGAPQNLQPTQLYRNRNQTDFYWKTTNAK